MNKKVQRQFLHSCAACLLAASLCLSGGCKMEPEKPAELEADTVVPGWQQHADEKVSFDWYINFSWFTTEWGENLVSKKITEETGVDIRFIVPMGNEAEKFNALILSDTLPDIITLGWWENQVDIMIDKDIVYALNELADEYDPYFWQVADETIINWYTQEDGNIYGYPNSSYVPKDYEEHDNIGSNQTFLVRKDIYEAIGSPDMTTPEGFKAAVRKAAEMFPEVDGKPLIPIGSHVFGDKGCDSFDLFLQNFLAVPYEQNGEYYDRFTDPEYIRWLKTFRELGEEGYLKEDIFIDRRIQMEEKLSEGRYFCMIFQYTDMADQQKMLYEKNPHSIYMAVDGPKNSKGDSHALPGGGIQGWTLTFISKNCEHPDRAIQFLSYLMSEQGQKMTSVGIEGVMYDMQDGKVVIQEEVLHMLNGDREKYDRIYGADSTYWMLQNNAMQLKWLPELTEPMKQLKEWTYPYTIYDAQYTLDFEIGTEAGNINMAVNQLWAETLPKLLLATTEEEFDRIFEKFVEEREALGFEILTQEGTKQIRANKERLFRQ